MNTATIVPTGFHTSVVDRLPEVIQRLVTHLRPEKIILFGSYAYGRPTEQSDLDMLVIVPFEGSSVRKSAEMRLLLDSEIAIDLLVRTPQQIQQRLKLGDSFYQDILTNGKVLYEAAY